MGGGSGRRGNPRSMALNRGWKALIKYHIAQIMSVFCAIYERKEVPLWGKALLTLRITGLKSE